MRSINQNQLADVLPDFRSLGVIMRIALLVNVLALLAALAQAASLQDILQRFIGMSGFFQPILLSSLLALYVLNGWLGKQAYWYGFAKVIAAVMLVAGAIAWLGMELYISVLSSHMFYLMRAVMLSGAVALGVMMYFRLRAMSLTRALHDARLQALQARIRPHFLFNSINAVLSIVRADPKRAESALEDMADLFRMAMANNLDMVAVRRELELSNQYLALEKLRLGDRLNVNWQVDDKAREAMIPPLILQPLLENGVYHGIEPLAGGGTIDVKLWQEGDVLHLDVRNPCHSSQNNHQGNRMALENIRERLLLKFDVEAKYAAERGADFYLVRIQMPYIKEEKE